MWNYWVPNTVLQSHNPYLHGSRNPKVYQFWHPISRASAHTFNPESLRDFALKSRINPEFQSRENQDLAKPNGVFQITPNIIIRYLALHIDCVLYVYLCHGLKLSEISESEYAKSKNIIQE